MFSPILPTRLLIRSFTRDVRILDELLIVQACHLIVRLELALGDFIDNVLRLSRGSGLVLVDFFFLFENLARNVFAPHIQRIHGRDVHGDILDERLKILAAGGEIRLAIHFDKNA